MDVKNVWLGRYVNNIGASTKYCNKLCNNPVIAERQDTPYHHYYIQKKNLINR